MEKVILEKLTTIENLLKQQNNKILTFVEAAKYLDVSRSYLYKLTCYNKIPHYKPQGKRIYFSQNELDTWLLRNPVKTEKEIEAQANDYIINKRASK